MANVPIAGEPFKFTITLFSQANGQPLLNPTITSADVLISTDGSALTTLTTTPSVNPPNSSVVEVDLTASEVGTEHFTVIFQDAFDAEWKTVVYHDVISKECGGGGGGGDGSCHVVVDADIVTAELSGEINTITLTGEIKEK